MPNRTSRRAMWIVLVLVVLGAAIPPYLNVSRYRKRVADSISRVLGRDVSVSSIELQLLPRPGLILSNFELADDPSYGAEPMLRSGTVTALLRLSSLWRGRLEIGTLEIDNPSLNLVRRADGHWNLEELIQRASQVPSAPTAKARPESRPRFPYVKASAGRINFKLGQVKKAFAFTDADFELWLASENQWSMRLEGRPMRTDVGLSDTGTVKVEGTFGNAPDLSSTPVNLKIGFSHGQLGQMSKLIFGRDRGWRGELSSVATVSGKPMALNVTLDGEVNDFRRYDIALGEALRLRAHCTATYSSPDDSIRDLLCESPVGSGVVRVRGTAQGWIGGNYDLGLSAEQLPMERVVAFARHSKKDLPADLTAAGNVDATFTVRRTDAGAPVWAGGGAAENVALRSDVLNRDLQLGEVQFAVPTSEPVRPRGPNSRAKPVSPVSGLRVEVKPFALPLDAVSPATARAVFDRQHYAISLDGDAELSRLMNVAHALGVATPGIGLAGDSTVSLNIDGSWAGFAQPVPSGRIAIQQATAELQGVSEPLQLISATAQIVDQQLQISAFKARFEEGPEFTGSASLPVHCTGPESCPVRFDVHAGDVALARLSELVNPSLAKNLWYHLLAVWQQHNDALLKLRANGNFSASHLTIGALSLGNVTGDAVLNAGKVHLDIIGSEVLGGEHSGAWDADFTQSPPLFTGGGGIGRVSMEQLSALMHDGWASGSLSLKYGLSMRGATLSALQDSATGSVSFSWNGGSLRHVTLEGRNSPMTFSVFNGNLALQHGTLQLTDGKLQAGNVTYLAKGKASYDRTLDLRLERTGGRSYVISGPLDKPRVETVASPSTEALLR